jgi:integrase
MTGERAWQFFWQFLPPFADNSTRHNGHPSIPRTTQRLNMARRPRKATTGRHKGSRQRGYWYRAGRGWYATDHGRSVPLLDEEGDHLKDSDTREEIVQQAHARHLLGQQRTAPEGTADTVPVADVVATYLEFCQANSRPATFDSRGRMLFDFVYGLPPKFWNHADPKHKTPKPGKNDYIHDGFGQRTVGSLIPMDVQRWLDKHPTWGQSTRRIAVQSVKRAFNYAVKMGLIHANPVKGFVAPQGKQRITYFTPEVEQAMYRHAKPALRLALRVLIRTGARYGSELCHLTAAHITDGPKGMTWKFNADEAKTNKPRVIYIPSDIAAEVRPLMARHPSGAIFRNTRGQPWDKRAMRAAFIRLKKRLQRKKVKMHPADCLYSTRHTYAKRMLGGYWGQPVSVEILAGLMGNSRQVCWDHYGKWCAMYTDPLQAAIEATAAKQPASG